MKKKIFPLCFLAVSTIAFAQDYENSIERIEIQSKFLSLPIKKINENIEVISAKEIAASPAKSIDELLQQTGGIDIRRRGANGVQSDISLRGSSFEQVLVLVNGIRMNDAQTGHNSMNIPVDLANVERIEIVKGASAQRFGNNAYAGVINIVTKTSTQETAKISAEAGDFSTYALGLSSTFGKGKFSNLFQATTHHSEGYRHSTDYDIHNYFYQNEYQLQNGKIGLQAGFSEKKFGANGFYASPAYTEQYEETQASIVALKHQQKFGNFNLNSNIYWRRGQDMYILIKNKPQVYRNMHIGNNLGGEINGSYRSKLGVTGVGVEVRKEYLVSSNLGDRNRFITQVFAEHHFSLINDKLQISPGISWSNFSNGGNFFYPGLNAGFDFDENHKIFGNISKVHRIPTFTDLYYKSKTELGNADLTPEHALSAELGYKFQKKNILAKVSGFLRNTDNAIDWLKNLLTDPWQAQNIGELRLKGVETEFKHRVNPWLDYGVSYTFLENKHSGDRLYRYSLDNFKHQFIANLGVKFCENLNSELIYHYNERASRYSYNLLDAKLNFQKENLSLYLLVNNLTNTNYTENFGIPMPKRWFHVGFRYNIKLND